MTFWRLVIRGVLYYWRTHLQVLLGATFAAAVLVGALAVGDSVRFTLRQQAERRLGKIEHILTAGDRFFRWQLADGWIDPTGPTPERSSVVAPVLLARGTASIGSGGSRANQIQILGIDDQFWRLSLAAFSPPSLATDEAAINRRLATHLGIQAGEEFILRVEKSRLMPADAPLASDKDHTLALRLRVKTVLNDDAMGAFSLRANPVVPFNVFLSAEWLAEKMDLKNKANLLLFSGLSAEESSRLQSRLRDHWRLADASLEVRYLPEQDCRELLSDRVFLDPAVVEALSADLSLDSAPVTSNTDVPQKKIPVLSYFVNEIRFGDRATPYSLITGAGSPIVPEDLADDEILLNEWLASDLNAKAGDPIELRYYVMGPWRQLQETSAVFTVRSVLPVVGAGRDSTLMPPFPGLAEAKSCRDWDPGIPVDLSRIRPKDEEYWERYRGTPKALISLRAAQKLWSNRFGNLTAIRFMREDARSIDSAPPATPAADVLSQTSSLERAILSKLAPSQLGLQLDDVRQSARDASRASVDFGQLFLGLSFFLILGALILTALLFAFGVEQRSAELGSLRALGFPRRDLWHLFLMEAGMLGSVGSILGSLAGLGYTHLVLAGLASLWKGAVAGANLSFHIEARTMIIGIVANVVVTLVTIGLVLRQQLKQTIHEAQQTGGAFHQNRPGGRWSLVLCLLSLAGAGFLLLTVRGQGGSQTAGIFFGAGGCLLIGFLAGVHALLRHLASQPSSPSLNSYVLSRRQIQRRPGRSLATIGTLACGVFLVVAVAANRKDPLGGQADRASGTGGFAFYGETSMPLLHDLNTATGRKFYALENLDKIRGVAFVMCRLHQGEDASCLNLNRAQQPSLLGVSAEALASREAFRWASWAPGMDSRLGWRILDLDLGADTVPAVADQTVIQWGLNKALGDTLSYRDERGRLFKVKLVAGLANSILQGRILISEQAFLSRFPSMNGSRVLLVDAPPGEMEKVRRELAFSLEDAGLELTPAIRRLTEFSEVENTYLSVFLLLGGLGLAVGSIGLAVVVMRNVLERRGELALMRALGFRKGILRRLLLFEHALLLLLAMGTGLLPAWIAVQPALQASRVEIPFQLLALILIGIVLNGLFWIFFAAWITSREELLPALREE